MVRQQQQFATGALKEYSKRDLLRVLDSVMGRKTLVIDPTVSGLLSLVADFNLLKDHGVEKIYYLSDTIIDTDSKSLVYLTRPTITHLKWIANQVKTTGQRVTEHSIFFVPKRSLIADKFLEMEGIYGGVTIGEFHLDVVPLDEDVLSLEMNSVFKDLYVEGDISVVQHLSNAIMKFQILYGFFPKVMGKGDNAQILAKTLETARVEYLSNASVTSNFVEGKDSEFDSMLIMDRTVDLFTLLRTPMTFEGMLDEIFTIKSSFVELDAKYFTSNPGQSKSKKIILNSSDSVYSSIRDQGFEVVPDVLNSLTLQLQIEEASHSSMTTPAELKAFAEKIKIFAAQKQSLFTFQMVFKKILEQAKLPPIKRRWKAEEGTTKLTLDITARYASSSILELIDDEIMMNQPFTVPLKLICMYSVANGGLKPKLFDQFKRDFCHAYGPKHIFTFQHLEKLGLYTNYDSKSKAHYANLSSSFNLVIDHISGIEQNDVSHIFHGYAPLSIRLIQLASSSIPDYSETVSKTMRKTLTWQGSIDLLKNVPGTTFEDAIIPESKSFKSSSNGGINLEKDAVPITLIVFIGGCTLAEISALRSLSQNEDRKTFLMLDKRKYVVLTTGICNGKQVLESLTEFF